MLTVGLPLYRSKNIGWLAMESLCRQETSQEWELLIIEEDGGMGLEEIKAYSERLTAAGCVNISYTVLKKWVPLSLKYYMMAEEAKGDIFMMQAGDDYSHPKRLQMTADNIGKYGLYQQPLGYFYNIETRNIIILDWDLAPGKHPCCLNMAYKMSLFKKIPYECKEKSVDLWIYTSIINRVGRFGIYFDHSQAWMKGVHTTGQNNISVSRREVHKRPHGRFLASNAKLENILPLDITKRLYDMRNVEPIYTRAGKYED